MKWFNYIFRIPVGLLMFIIGFISINISILALSMWNWENGKKEFVDFYKDGDDGYLDILKSFVGFKKNERPM